MSATAILAVSTSQDDYSRYSPDPAYSQVVVRFVPATPAPGDAFAVALVRQDGYGAVATTTYTWTGGEVGGVGRVTFDLAGSACMDAHGLYRAVQGDYTATATLVANPAVAAASPPFSISLVGVEELRRTWLYGINLLATEVRGPRWQPRLVTGVTILECSPSHPSVVYPLVYAVQGGAPSVVLPIAGQTPGAASFWSLAWGNGAPVPIAPGVRAQYTLLDERGEDWALVAVDPLLLPATSTSENIVVDVQRMTDRDLVRYVRLATGQVEGALGGSYPLEPRYISTDHDPALLPTGQALVEEPTLPSTWQRPGNVGGNWLQVKLTRRGILWLAYLKGYMNTTQVVDVPMAQWPVLSEKAGRVDLVPSTGASISWMLYGQPFFAFLYNYDYVPSFWHWGGVCGLRDLFAERAPVREAVAKLAAINILLAAGGAYRAGITGQSTSRDGVSESVSYSTSAMYGPYAHLTVPYGQWLDDNLPRIRRRVIGVQFVTLE